MELLTWIMTNRPGDLIDIGDRIEIEHKSGEHSTLWRRTTGPGGWCEPCLGDAFLKYDGIDLFSSTFKLASTNTPRLVDDVKLVFTFQQIDVKARQLRCLFPAGSVPFMYQAGIGYYACNPTSNSIYEWDTETQAISGMFASLEDILDEWISAVS